MFWFFAELVLLIFLFVFGCKNGLPRLALNIFNVMWCGGLAFSNLGLFELYTPSDRTNVFFIVAIISFNIVYNFFQRRQPVCGLLFEESSSLKNVSIKFQALFIANIIVLAVCLPFIPKAWSISQLHGMSYLRGLVYTQSGEYFSNIYVSLLFQWLIQPFLQFVLLIAASQIYDIRNNKRLLFVAILDLCVEMLLFGGGRRTAMMFFLQMMLFYLLRNPIHLSGKSNLNFKKIGAVVVGILLMIYTIINITASRLTQISVGESVFQYYVGPYIFFDKITNEATNCTYFADFTYGSCIFSFIIVPFNIIKMILWGEYTSSAAQVLNANLDNVVSIGNHSVHNAHATSLIYFCSDFGFSFSFLGMAFFAGVLAYFTKKYQESNQRLILAVYFASLTFYSAQTYPFVGVIQYVIISLTLLFIKNENKQLLLVKRCANAKKDYSD